MAAITGVRSSGEQPGDELSVLKGALAQAQNHLAQAQSQHAQAEKRAQEAEAAAIAAREELQGFVYAASHDVKEALRSVSSYAQLLVRHAPADGELGEFGQFITEGVRSAVAILDRLNAFSRIDPAPRKMPVKLHVLAQMALLNHTHTVKELGANVTVEDMPEAPVNEAQWISLFDNLLDNALKYRGTEPPRISISSVETDEGLEVAVRDNGPGIAPEYQAVVFRPFKRLHGKEIRGIGLGLSLCQKIAAAHHARIWVESDGSHGATFKVLLPY